MPETQQQKRDGEFLRPPTFLSDKSKFKQYKRDLQRWIRCTDVEKKRQGDIILMNIPESNPLKEALDQAVGDKVVNNGNGATLILDELEAMFGSDEVL